MPFEKSFSLDETRHGSYSYTLTLTLFVRALKNWRNPRTSYVHFSQKKQFPLAISHTSQTRAKIIQTSIPFISALQSGFFPVDLFVRALKTRHNPRTSTVHLPHIYRSSEFHLIFIATERYALFNIHYSFHLLDAAFFLWVVCGVEPVVQAAFHKPVFFTPCISPMTGSEGKVCGRWNLDFRNQHHRLHPSPLRSGGIPLLPNPKNPSKKYPVVEQKENVSYRIRSRAVRYVLSLTTRQNTKWCLFFSYVFHSSLTLNQSNGQTCRSYNTFLSHVLNG